MEHVSNLSNFNVQSAYGQVTSVHANSHAPSAMIQQPTVPSVVTVSAYQTTPPRKKRKQFENITTGRWSKQEHDLFLRGLETFGKEWKSIASLIPTRTVVQIRTHAQKYFQKMKKRKARGESIDSVTSIRSVEESRCVKKTPSVGEICVKKTAAIPLESKSKIRSKRSFPKRPLPKRPIFKGARKKKKNTRKTFITPQHIYPTSDAGPSPTSQVDLTFHFPASQNCSESVASLFPTIFPTGFEFDGIFGTSNFVEQNDSSQEQLVLETLPCEQEEFNDLCVGSITSTHQFSLF